jgi:hypothetical protein
MTVSALVKSPGGSYKVGSLDDSSFKVGVACFSVGDRVAIQPDNLSPRRQYLAHATGEITSITRTKASVLLDEPANKAYKPHTVKVDLCSLIWISSRESEDFRLQQKQLEESGQLNLSSLIQMPNSSCFRASQESPSTQISGTFPPELENMSCLLWDFPAREPALQVTEPDSSTQSQACGSKHCGASHKDYQPSSLLKILRGLSLEDYEQCLGDSEFADIVGMIHKSYRLRNSERRTKEKGFSSLPTPTTYAKGSGKYRPAGATRLEQSLRKFIREGDKLHPAVPGWMMGFRPGWVEEILMAGGEIIGPPITPECVTTHPNAENVTTSTPVQSRPSKLPLPSSESCTCPHCCEPLFRLEDGCGVCGWVRSQFLEDKGGSEISSRKMSSDTFLEDKFDSEISSRKRRRRKGDGSGCIYWRTVTKKGKDYHEAYYQYEFWNGGDRLIKSTKYIPKRLLTQVQQMEQQKAPVREILMLLGVVE